MEVKQPIPRWVTSLLEFSRRRPRRVLFALVAISLAFAAASPWVVVDTDPENMLRADEPVRSSHRRLKGEFAQHDMIVVGVVNSEHPAGVFNDESLAKITAMTRFAEALGQDKDPPSVVAHDVLSLATVDDIKPLGGGRVHFDWLISRGPTTASGAQEVGERARRNPFLVGSVVSADGKAAAIYVPISSKDVSYRISNQLREYAAKLGGPERFYVAGLPVAEDTFGVEMFIQMAISAPAAMILVFVMMLVFFRRFQVVVAPMIVAMLSVFVTMGALIATGNALHIMSSMIPIFIMPIAVLDTIHIVSELHDRFRPEDDRWELVQEVLSELYRPMLFTSLTSAAGFASLALTPIPPVRVFGIFVAIGIMVAWLFTIFLIPAWFMLLSPRTLERFGERSSKERGTKILSPLLQVVGRFGIRRRVPIVVVSLGLLATSIVGITRIEINDNPVKWFASSHPLRQADRIMNKHFGGTYMAYLALEANGGVLPLEERLDKIESAIENARVKDEFAKRRSSIDSTLAESDQLLSLSQFVDEREETSDESDADAWGELGAVLSSATEPDGVFNEPKLLQYLLDYQRATVSAGLVGKANSLADILTIVNRELQEGADDQLRLPATRGAVSQALLAYESSHHPHLLWHFATRDFQRASVWFQLKRGDNKDMEALTRFTTDYIAAHPSPVELNFNWFGLTYLNAVWQGKMVGGMTRAIIGSVLIIFLLMTVLLRSSLWGLVSMVPFVVSIVVIYGVIGLLGKSYDMPVAVLSSLTLGLAVDFAVHFTVRARAMHRPSVGWSGTIADVFGAPARAIARNALVVSIGFTPLLIAPLTPYRTVGLLLASILLLSAVSCLLLLPALLKLLEKPLFRQRSDLSYSSLAVVGVTVVAFSSVAVPALIGGGVLMSALGGLVLASVVVVILGSRTKERTK